MTTIPRPVPFGSFRADGITALRGQRLLARLQTGKYLPDRLWTQSADATWPGDTEGRTVLALELLTRALGTSSTQLTEHRLRWPRHLNRLGYFGATHGADLDEQQLASHGWVLRALCEGVLASPGRGDALRGLIAGVIDGLVLPNADAHAEYPIDHRRDVTGGSHSGSAARKRGRWILSTDIGCDWILMDGLAQVLDLAPDRRLAALVDAMIHRFMQVDLVALGMQTHATLTALRACLRRAAQTADAGLVAAVRERYAIYLAHGMTANWANHNWFGRPTWTEPCAMVDAFQVALGLWQASGDPAYLGDAHRFWHSALGHGQRCNGGFGPDTCCGAPSTDGGSGDLLGMSVFEAHWCCSMRGGEGIARAIEAAWWTAGDDLWLVLPQPGTAQLPDGTAIRLDTGWPHDGRLRLEIIACPAPRRLALRFFIPPGCTPAIPCIGGVAADAVRDAGFLVLDRTWGVGEVVDLDLRPQTRIERHGDGRRSIWHGPLMLAAAPDAVLGGEAVVVREAPTLWRCGGALLHPVDDTIHRHDLDAARDESWKGFRRRVLFA